MTNEKITKSCYAGLFTRWVMRKYKKQWIATHKMSDEKTMKKRLIIFCSLSSQDEQCENVSKMIKFSFHSRQSMTNEKSEKSACCASFRLHQQPFASRNPLIEGLIWCCMDFFFAVRTSERNLCLFFAKCHSCLFETAIICNAARHPSSKVLSSARLLKRCFYEDVGIAHHQIMDGANHQKGCSYANSYANSYIYTHVMYVCTRLEINFVPWFD